ncbi:MAG: hypothetical protein Q4E88_02785 [Coriobacteriia bacterium]|nr:hypothetical protein [Coriobacteriia bacterium]
MSITINQQQLANYRANIEQQAQNAVNVVRQRLQGRTGTASELSSVANNAIREVLPYFSDNAQLISCMVFDEICAKAGNNVSVQFYDDLIDWNSISSRVKQLAMQYADDDIEEFYNQLYYMIADQVRGCSRKTMSRNCSENNMAYQIIASPDACMFCLAMASRGAMHWDEDGYADDGFFHDHCNCTPMPADDVNYSGNEADDYYDEYIKQRDELLEKREEGRERGDGRFADHSKLFGDKTFSHQYAREHR